MVEKTVKTIRTISAYFIKARGIIPHQEAEYTEATLSLSSSKKVLAKRGETIYGGWNIFMPQPLTLLVRQTSYQGYHLQKVSRSSSLGLEVQRTGYSGTKLRMVYELISSRISGNQEFRP